MPRGLRKEFHKKGYILIPNALSNDLFEKVENEIYKFEGTGYSFYEGTTRTCRVRLTPENFASLPNCHTAVKDERLNNYIKYCAGKKDPLVFYLQIIQNLWRKGIDDVQRNLHADTFHPTVKYWLYISDVNLDLSPLNYVEGSNRLTFKRLVWEYKKSLIAKEARDGGTEQGSFRISDEELVGLDLPPPKSLIVPKNTLIIANTFGFHRRGRAHDANDRIELWGYSRKNPFSLFLGTSNYKKIRIMHKNLDKQEPPPQKNLKGWQIRPYK